MPELQASLERSAMTHCARLHEIRRERAARLANREASAIVTADTLRLFVFKLGDELYGVELNHVARVFMQPVITPLPGAPTALLGIVNLQGEVRSVLDLRRLLSLPDGGANADGYVLLLRHNGGLVGLRVEQLDEVRHIARSEVLLLDPNAHDRFTRFAQCITNDKVVILDTAALLDPTSILSPAE